MTVNSRYLDQVLQILTYFGFNPDQIETRDLSLNQPKSHNTVCYCNCSDWGIGTSNLTTIYPAVHLWASNEAHALNIRLGWFEPKQEIPLILGNHASRFKFEHQVGTRAALNFNDQLESLKFDLGTLPEQCRELNSLARNTNSGSSRLDDLLSLSQTASQVQNINRRESQLLDAWHFITVSNN